MPGKTGMPVKEYIGQLRETRKGKPPQIREALDIYVMLWEKAVENGVVSEEDEVSEALSKLDKAGGLYQAASSA
ncbi:MAG: hypothetical protein JRN58_08925 [Nitrososphaerota archaeon]|nr:hypothetical protein [Nitrososphaerota archaeon]MDG7022657.1 hypothetical protein [Nitrososphaerota archaeon]